jgi:hypothetical protein
MADDMDGNMFLIEIVEVEKVIAASLRGRKVIGKITCFQLPGYWTR